MGMRNGGGSPHRGPEQFWSQTDRTSDCWEWTGYVWKTGYGCARYLMRNWPAHRLAWTLANGEIPAGASVLHRCDNRKCVRPDHLFLGTHADNMQDMVQKGRARNPGAEAALARTQCKRGHELTPENTFARHINGRGCRECRRLLYAERYREKALVTMRDAYLRRAGR